MLDVLDSIGVMRHAHRPAEDASTGFGIEPRRGLDPIARDPAVFDDAFPARRVDHLDEFVPAIAVVEHEGVIDGLAR